MSEYIYGSIGDPLANVLGEIYLPRAEVVRCRDCAAYEPYHTYAGMKLDYGECMQHKRQTDDDRFCWWAERSDR